VGARLPLLLLRARTWCVLGGGGDKLGRGRVCLQAHVVLPHAHPTSTPLAPQRGCNPPPACRYGSRAQQERWLLPLLRGHIRSCFAMTEKEVASSDATNITASIRPAPGGEGAGWVVSGRKWWTSGAMDPRCKVGGGGGGVGARKAQGGGGWRGGRGLLLAQSFTGSDAWATRGTLDPGPLPPRRV
jgi:alkylation response protein AidB-like acyl-CoA dehydrogenase